MQVTLTIDDADVSRVVTAYTGLWGILGKTAAEELSLQLIRQITNTVTTYEESAQQVLIEQQVQEALGKAPKPPKVKVT